MEPHVPSTTPHADAPLAVCAVVTGGQPPPARARDRVTEAREPRGQATVVAGERDRDDARVTEEGAAEIDDPRQPPGDQLVAASPPLLRGVRALAARDGDPARDCREDQAKLPPATSAHRSG